MTINTIKLHENALFLENRTKNPHNTPYKEYHNIKYRVPYCVPQPMILAVYTIF